MIAKNVVDFCSFFAGSEYVANYVCMCLWKIPASCQPPTINDITNQIQCVTCVVFKKIDESLGLTPSGSKAHVTYEDCPNKHTCIYHTWKKSNQYCGQVGDRKS